MERRCSIMRAAAEMVDAIGYDALTMDQLAEHAGITKPTLYAYFPNKEAILVGLMQYDMAATYERVAMMLQEARSAALTPRRCSVWTSASLHPPRRSRSG